MQQFFTVVDFKNKKKIKMNSVVINQLILSVTLCAKQFYSAAKPKQIGMVPPAIK